MRYDDVKFLWRCDHCTYNGFNDAVVRNHEDTVHGGPGPEDEEIEADLVEEDEEIDPEVAAEFAAAQEALQAMLLTEDDFNDAGKQALELLKLMEK